MTDVLGDAGIPPAAPAAVMADTPCRKCQYNLRGLSLDGRCPECGTPVGFSLRSRMLRFSDPAWIGTVRAGTQCIFWATITMCVAAVGGHSPSRTLVLLGGNALWLLGGWLLTTPDPGGVGEDAYGTRRKLIRVTLACGVVEQIVDLVLQTAAVPPTIHPALVLISSAGSVADAIGLIATLKYLTVLAWRIPDHPLAYHVSMLVYGLGVPYAVVLGVALAVNVFHIPGRGSTISMIVGVTVACAGAFSGLFVILFGALYLVDLRRFTKRLGEQAALARSTWATPPLAVAAPAP